MNAQLATALIAGLSLLINLAWLVVVLRIKVEILQQFEAFRRELSETYVLKEVCDRVHAMNELNRHPHPRTL